METKMARSFADPGRIGGFHVHIYYDARTRPMAESLREAIAAQFTVELGRWHDEPVGPHPTSMYQVAFAAEEFGRFLPWLMLHRSGLDVLVHPQTGDAYADHTEHASWLGTKLPLRVDVLRRNQPA
jgi:DOPA 4,5-dioxygenase